MHVITVLEYVSMLQLEYSFILSNRDIRMHHRLFSGCDVDIAQAISYVNQCISAEEIDTCEP